MRVQLDEPRFGLKTSILLAGSSSLVTRKLSRPLFVVVVSFFLIQREAFARPSRAERPPLRWLTLGYLEIVLCFSQGWQCAVRSDVAAGRTVTACLQPGWLCQQHR